MRELHTGGGVQGEGGNTAHGGEGGYSSSMKRVQTAEEREREAKVCGAPGVWDSALVRG